MPHAHLTAPDPLSALAARSAPECGHRLLQQTRAEPPALPGALRAKGVARPTVAAKRGLSATAALPQSPPRPALNGRGPGTAVPPLQSRATELRQNAPSYAAILATPLHFSLMNLERTFTKLLYVKLIEYKTL
ncbi:hypothetical protein NDU88_007086 [Pleurodeles waltl]|uniref:Uncharacterized protein n=1 Tax=Pleurodeles waltl TaxID=8319 RepID=A0AAV7RNE9_PLEWA|nr:hypothetical protein NDU88_007086 [Pleurodeles waltl]